MNERCVKAVFNKFKIPLDTQYHAMYSIVHEEVCILNMSETKGGMKLDIQLKRGMLDICVLSALLREDSYGYKIIKDLQPYVAISESTLYPILRRLEGAGALNVYSAEHNGRLRKYYAITPVGRERIQEFLNEWKGMLAIYEYIEGEMKNHD